MGKLKDLFLFDKVKLRQLKTVSALVGLFAAIGRCCAWLVCVCVHVMRAFVLLLNVPLVLSDLIVLASLAIPQYRNGANFYWEGKAPDSHICNADFTLGIKWHYCEGHPHSVGSR